MHQFDVTYQRVFMASPVKEGFYQPYPARERYYDKMAESLIKAKVRSDGTIKNDKLNKAITQLKAEREAGHERNILDMTQVDEYMSPGENIDASTVNDSSYHNSDEYEDEISDSSKKVEASKEAITDTHIFNRVRNLLGGIVSFNPAVTVVRIIGRGGRGIT